MVAIYRGKITRKGQVTIPVDIRNKFDFNIGDTVLFEVVGNKVSMLHPDDFVDPTAGALAKYAYTSNPDPAEERRWVAQHIAETADDYE